MQSGMPVVLPFAEAKLNFPSGNVCIDGDVCALDKRGTDTVNKYQTIRYGINFIAGGTQSLFWVKILHSPCSHDAKHRIVRQFAFNFCIQLSGRDCQIICVNNEIGMRE